ncbi:MAG: hypothetical protein ACR5LF_03790 [Symbiopectobacterium sp.]
MLVPLDADRVRVDQLFTAASASETLPRAVFLTQSHQFPSSATLSLDRRLAVIAWARQHHSWIIENDYDSEFHYAGKPIACVGAGPVRAHDLYLGTFTKSLFPGLRISYMVLPPSLVAPMTVARTLLDGHSAPSPNSHWRALSKMATLVPMYAPFACCMPSVAMCWRDCATASGRCRGATWSH